MKNYVVWTNCDIADKSRSMVPDAPKTDQYNEMFEISRASARKYLAGSWTDIVWTEPAETRVSMFKRSWQQVWDLWHSEPCNILYLDSDTIFQRATEIFGRFEEFRLFNWSTPKSKSPFDNYFNAGVRYYPATMSADIWQLGSDLAENWNLEIWDQEQIIFNHMFWAQNLAWADAHRPELNWQWPATSSAQTMRAHNTTPVDQAHIIHYHGTRGCERAARLAADLAKQAGITYEIN